MLVLSNKFNIFIYVVVHLINIFHFNRNENSFKCIRIEYFVSTVIVATLFHREIWSFIVE